MDIGILLSIIGVLLLLGVTINGFFLRGIFVDLNAVRIELAVVITNSNNSKEKMEQLQKKTDEHEDSVQNLRQRIHSIEGAQAQLLKFIEQFEHTP